MKGIYIFFLLLVVSTGQAQSVDYSDIIPSNSFRYYTFLGKLNNNYFLSINDNKELRLKLFNDKMRYKGDLKIRTAEKSKFNLLQNFIKDEKAYFVIEQYKKENSLYLLSYDFKSKQQDSINLVPSTDQKMLSARIKVLDDKYLLAHSKVLNKLHYKLYDIESKTWLLVGQSIEIKNKETVKQIFLSDDQIHVILVDKNENKRKLLSSKIISIDTNSGKYQEEPLKIDSLKQVDFRFYKSYKDNEIRGFVTYKTSTDAWMVSSLTNNNGQWNWQNSELNLSEAEKKALSKNEDTKLRIIGFSESSDDKMRLVLEEYNEEIEIVPTVSNDGVFPNYITERIEFSTYGNVYVPVYNSTDWKLDTMTFIPKQQRDNRNRSGYLSSLVIPTKENLVLVYNEIEVAKDVMVHYINPKNEQNRTRLLVQDMVMSPMRVRYGKHTGPEEVVFSRFKDGGLQLIRVEL